MSASNVNLPAATSRLQTASTRPHDPAEPEWRCRIAPGEGSRDARASKIPSQWTLEHQGKRTWTKVRESRGKKLRRAKVFLDEVMCMQHFSSAQHTVFLDEVMYMQHFSSTQHTVFLDEVMYAFFFNTTHTHKKKNAPCATSRFCMESGQTRLNLRAKLLTWR